MNVSYSPIYFQGRKQEIKRADDILRKTNNAFPLISTTKHATKTQYSNIDDWDNYYAILSKISLKIQDQRSDINDAQQIMRIFGYNKANAKIIPILQTVKKTKLGNCHEGAYVTFATLCKEGYLNSRPVNLVNNIEVLDKKTGEKRTFKEGIDHAAVITSMEKEDSFDINKCDYIIDPWINFADDKVQANRKYLTFYKKTIKEQENLILATIHNDYIYNGLQQFNGRFDENNYQITSKIGYELKDDFTDEEVKSFTDKMSFEYKYLFWYFLKASF